MSPVIRHLLIFLAAGVPHLILAATGDLDNDGLRDAVETNTGIYVTPNDTGTNPSIADSDGDSLPDGLELNLGTNPTSAASKVKRPNIIYILADDLGYGDVGCFWQNQRSGIWKFQTPGLDAMAAEGVKMTHHYVGAPICASSRASFMLGQHQGHSDIRDAQFDKALPDNHTISRVLQAAGYRTIHVGKAGLAGTLANPLLSSENLAGHPLKRGFDRYFGYLRHVDGHEHYPRNGTATRTAVIHNDYAPVTDAYQDLFTSDAWTAFAKKSIIEETNLHPERPFFLYLSYDTPHFYGETAPSSEYPAGRGLNGGIQWTGAPSYANTATNNPANVDNLANRHASVNSAWYDRAQKYVSMIRRMDDSVADILQTLRDLGIDRNTLVVFTSDNGPSDTEVVPTSFQSYAGFEGIKTDIWEGGIRVPTIAWWPGTITGTNQLSNIRETALPCANWDWLATFAELAKTQTPSRSDGVSLVPALTGKGVQKEHDFLYFEFNYAGFTSRYPDFPTHGGDLKKQTQAIRIGNFKGVRNNIQNATDPFKIYDLITDPKESIDLAPNHPDLQEKIQGLSISSRRPVGGAGRVYDTALVPSVSRPSFAPGLNWKTYEGYWPCLPDLGSMVSVSAGSTSNISASLLSRSFDSGLQFTGYISVPTSGSYTFQTLSDGPTSLRIHEGLVIDNDCNFTPTANSAQVYLKSGRHPIRLYYRHLTGTASLELKYSGPGIPLQTIPSSVFFMDGPPPPPPDRDGDGVPDADELIAGTNPDNSSSYLRIRSVSRENGAITLRWNGSAGRTYRVQESADLSTWKPVPNLEPLIVATELADAFKGIPENGALKRFFRISASITPPQPPSDRDGDGSPDDAEAIAGTNPDDPTSYFKIHTFAKSENGMSLQWAGVAGRTYRVEESIDLSIWTLVPGVVPVVVTTTQPAASITVPENGALKRFLRMQVTLTP